MTNYKEIYNIVVNEYGIAPHTKLEFNGFYLTVDDYLKAVIECGGYKNILSIIKVLQYANASDTDLLAFLKGASSHIIFEATSGNERFAVYYKDKIKHC